ncbi:MAG TPA: hypothetical protein VGR28_09180 [Candidatus Thermoplasmatota archaeon]|jgi:hypothetical protein|nr:hypothetical protein [Candidatus Thermoplasmatota archaeon]
MRALAVLVAAALVGLGAGLVAAHSPSSNASCNSVHEDKLLRLPILGEAVIVVPVDIHTGPVDIGDGLVVVGPIHVGSTYYISPDFRIYRESNAWPGLQDHAHTCRPDTSHHDFDKVTIPADEPALLLSASIGGVSVSL